MKTNGKRRPPPTDSNMTPYGNGNARIADFGWGTQRYRGGMAGGVPIPAAWHLIVFNHFPVVQAGSSAKWLRAHFDWQNNDYTYIEY